MFRPFGFSPMSYSDVRAALAEAPLHADLRSGFPFEPEPVECEVCDILWLMAAGEGDGFEHLFNLRDARGEYCARTGQEG